MKLIQSEKQFDDLNYERAWLLRTAINTCIDKLRHWWNKTQSFCEADFVSFDENHGEVFAAVSALPDKYRIPVFLFYYEGYKCDEIASILNIPPATVRTRLARARAMLREALMGDRPYV